jgi:L-threonylcarbamoyladenylate synthase
MAEIGTDIFAAINHLENGNLVAIPTETVYGLAANAFDNEAVAKIFTAKNRPSFDPLIVHTSSFDRVSSFTKEINDNTYKLAESFCPGPVTFILKKTETIPDLVTSGHSTVGVRIPRHPLTQTLLESLEFPVAAPSANPFGYVSPTTAEHVNQQLGDKLPYILDGGPSTVGVESTIIDASEDQVEILRLGGLTLEEIEEVLGRKVDLIKTSSSNPNAPGMLFSHYSPGIPLTLGPIDWESLEKSSNTFGVLTFGKQNNLPKNALEFCLSKSKNVNEAAANLFRGLRYFVGTEVRNIYAEKLPDEGLGRAINDRLTRAAATIV